MKILLNGSSVDTESADLEALVREQGIDPTSLVIEHNLSVIKQAKWPATPIREGDTIELLNFVGGG